MAFKRALWHSGLTYQQTCHECKTVIQYTDEKLDFRPWFPDGFVYCPKCKTPLRHSECLAINGDNAIRVQPAATTHTSAGQAKFCSQCGKPFNDNDRFCTECGTKRV